MEIVDETLLVHLFELVFLVLQHNEGCSSSMDGCDNLWEIAFQIVDRSYCFINVFLYFLQNLFQMLTVDWEVIFEDSNCLLARFDKDNGDFVDKVDFRYKHSCEIWTDQGPVFKFSVELYGVHSERSS